MMDRMLQRHPKKRALFLLPSNLTHRLYRWLRWIGGSLLIGCAVAIFLCLISYHPQDPSWNHVIDGTSPANMLGRYGAYFADIAHQALGSAAFILPIILGIWGGLMMRHHTLRYFWMRNLSLIFALTITAGLYHMMITRWKSAGQFLSGGVVGSIIAKAFSILTLDFPIRIGLVASAALACFWFASGLKIQIRKTLISPLMELLHWSGQVLWQKVTRRRTMPQAHRRFFNVIMRWIEQYLTFSSQDRPQKAPKPHKKPSASTSTETTTAPNLQTASRKTVKKSNHMTQSIPLQHGGQDYLLPSVKLLSPAKTKNNVVLSAEILKERAHQLEQVLEEFGIRGEIVEVCPGPVVTLYELKPAPGIKTARVIGLSDDIARSMSALSTRIAVIPGRNVIGIELPNTIREMVYLRELLEAEAYQVHKARLPLILGKDIGGSPTIVDLARMPHLLVAGTTGSGKSVAINTMILSLLYRLSPEQCKFIMIDPKMLELSVYDDIPHLLSPVVTDPKKAVVALKWAVREMEERYRAMAKLGVRNIDGYNERLQEARANNELLMRRVQTGFDPETGRPIFENQPLEQTPLPYIVVIVDEMADLMLVAGKEIEAAVQRLAQMARAAGIHLIMATQRPSVDVITGTIKANFPTRISFQVTSKIDSRTILGEQGAEQLLGQGDMLYMAGGGRISRVHGPFVQDEEVERIVAFLKQQGQPHYIESITHEDEESLDPNALDDQNGGDPMYQQAIELIRAEGKVSTSFIQRHLQIGYNRAARIVDQMEKAGIISPANHAGKREILM